MYLLIPGVIIAIILMLIALIEKVNLIYKNQEKIMKKIGIEDNKTNNC